MKTERIVRWELKNGKKAECKIEVSNEVVTETAYADGANVELSKSVKEYITITLTVDGKIMAANAKTPEIITKTAYGRDYAKMVAAGVHARLGDVYVAEAQYKMIIEAVESARTELAKDAVVVDFEETTVKNAKNNSAVVIDDGLESEHNGHGAGWCNKCKSYCWGDCTAS